MAILAPSGSSSHLWERDLRGFASMMSLIVELPLSVVSSENWEKTNPATYATILMLFMEPVLSP